MSDPVEPSAPPATRCAQVCAARGHHGPFRNLGRYAAVPGWDGFGDCAECGSTCWAGAADAPTPPLPPLA